jgi:hypothetical protein
MMARGEMWAYVPHSFKRKKQTNKGEFLERDGLFLMCTEHPQFIVSSFVCFIPTLHEHLLCLRRGLFL